MSRERSSSLTDRILNDPKLLTGSVVGAAFLGVTVWSVSVLGSKKPDDNLKAAKLAMPADAKLKETIVPSRERDESSHLGVKKLRASEFSESVITADSIAALDEQDASAEEATETMSEVRAMQMEAQKMAGIHGQVADSAAMIEEARKRREKMGSLGKVDTLRNTDYVAAGAAALAKAKNEVEGPIDPARAREIASSGLIARKPSGGGPTRHFLKRQAHAGGNSLGRGNANLARASGSGGAAASFSGANGGAAIPGTGALNAPQAGTGGAGLGGGGTPVSSGAGAGAGAALGVGGGGGGGGGASEAGSKDAPTAAKSWRAIEGQASDFLVVADSYHTNVVTKVTEHEKQYLPPLRSSVIAADGILAALLKTVLTAKVRYRSYPAALSAASDVEAMISVEQRPRLKTAGSELNASWSVIERVPKRCLDYISRWETETRDMNNGGDDGGYVSKNERERMAKEGWSLNGDKWTKQVEYRDPVDARTGALAAHKRLIAALEDVRHVRQLAEITERLAGSEMSEVAATIPESAEANAFLAFSSDVGAGMRRVMDLIPGTLMVGQFTGDYEALQSLQEHVLKGRLDVRDMNKRAKNQNLAFPESRERNEFQSHMTDAANNSSEALAHVSSSGENLYSLVKTGEESTEAYLDLCDARKKLLSMTEIAKK
jgi:hypothetical protein